MQTLRGIAERLGLDYAGIDFARAPDGQIIVFEANTAMTMVMPTDEPMWDYRRAAIGRAIAAAQTMLLGTGRA
jgi:glutathione synthase/RimK-type ligase-like ATP-grasp enzyme